MRMYKICHHAAMWYRLYSKSTYWVSQSTYCFWLLLEIACETFPSCWYAILLSTRFSKFYQSWQDWASFREKSKKRPTFGRPRFRPRLYKWDKNFSLYFSISGLSTLLAIETRQVSKAGPDAKQLRIIYKNFIYCNVGSRFGFYVNMMGWSSSIVAKLDDRNWWQKLLTDFTIFVINIRHLLI